MSRNIEEPVTITREGPGGSETVTTHPAFGQISVSRVSGGNSHLYDSDFTHQYYMMVRIGQSELHRNLSRDWHYSKRDGMIEIAMTESQWATFVSSPNMGSGVPCTLKRLMGQTIPDLPAPEARTKQFGEEVKRDLADMLKEMTDLEEMVEGLGLSKTKAALLLSKLRSAKASVTSSIPFVAKQFEEHMEDTVEAAKAEVHGYMTGVIQRAGLETLTGGRMPLHLGDDTDGRA